MAYNQYNQHSGWNREYSSYTPSGDAFGTSSTVDDRSLADGSSNFPCEYDADGFPLPTGYSARHVMSGSHVPGAAVPLGEQPTAPYGYPGQGPQAGMLRACQTPSGSLLDNSGFRQPTSRHTGTSQVPIFNVPNYRSRQPVLSTDTNDQHFLQQQQPVSDHHFSQNRTKESSMNLQADPFDHTLQSYTADVGSTTVGRQAYAPYPAALSVHAPQGFGAMPPPQGTAGTDQGSISLFNKYTLVPVAFRNMSYTLEGSERLTHLTLGDSLQFKNEWTVAKPPRPGKAADASSLWNAQLYSTTGVSGSFVRELYEEIKEKVTHAVKASGRVISTMSVNDQGAVTVHEDRAGELMVRRISCELIALGVEELWTSNVDTRKALTERTIGSYKTRPTNDTLTLPFAALMESVPQKTVDVLTDMATTDRAELDRWTRNPEQGFPVFWGVGESTRYAPTREYAKSLRDRQSVLSDRGSSSPETSRKGRRSKTPLSSRARRERKPRP